MDSRGDVRTAYEFKDIFDDAGVSHRPYRCPFCEVPYEDRCIITECVKAPHFKLPNGRAHYGDCDGEPASASPADRARPASRVVDGEIDVPEALVPRRPPRRVTTASSGGIDAPPSGSEIHRRRKILAADRVIASKFTSALLRAIVSAHKRLMKAAFEKASASGHAKGTPEYRQTFRTLLDSRPLELFGQALTYSSAFLTSRLAPTSKPRIYGGVGAVAMEDAWVKITDVDTWPKEYKSPEHAPFAIYLAADLPADAITQHVRAIEELAALATKGKTIRWWAYGRPALYAESGWVLQVASLDHIYWEAVS